MGGLYWKKMVYLTQLQNYGSARFYNRGDALESQHSLCLPLNVYKCFVWIYICVLHVCLVPLAARVIDGCEPPCRCWELNPHPLQDSKCS